MPELHALFFSPPAAEGEGAPAPDEPQPSAQSLASGDLLTPAMICEGLRRLGHDMTPAEAETLACSIGWQRDVPPERQGVPWRDFAVALLGWSAPARRTFIRSFFEKMDGEGRGCISRGVGVLWVGGERVIRMGGGSMCVNSIRGRSA